MSEPILSDSFYTYRYGFSPFYYLFFVRWGQKIKIQAPWGSLWKISEIIHCGATALRGEVMFNRYSCITDSY
jgi:hypothetical protein